MTEEPSGAAPDEGGTEEWRRPVRLVIITSMLAKVADWQLGIVVPLAILDQTGSAAAALTALALRGAAYVGAPIVGSMIDRYDKRRVFVLAQLQQAVCIGLLCLTLSNSVAVSILLFLAGFGAVASSINGSFVLIPSLVQGPARDDAVARLSSAIELSKVAGLILGGIFFSSQGPIVACVVVTALYALAGVSAALLPAIPSIHDPSSLAQGLKVGFTWLVRPGILWLVVTMSIANLAVGELETVLITIFGREHVDATAISVILAAGLLVGAAASRFAGRVLPHLPVEKRVLVFQTMCFLSLCIVTLPGVYFKIAGYLAISLSFAFSNVASILYRQDVIPIEFAGRINAVIRMFITGSISLSGFIFAFSSRWDGYLFWVPAMVLSTVSVLIWTWFTLSRSEDRSQAGSLE